MNFRDSASCDNDKGVPDFDNEKFMALSYSLICERLGLRPGRSADESLEILRDYRQRKPEERYQIDEAVDYGSKEAMFRWTDKVALLSGFSFSSKGKRLSLSSQSSYAER